jgi:hypothetical protein
MTVPVSWVCPAIIAAVRQYRIERLLKLTRGCSPSSAIGTVCWNSGLDTVVSCIDAYGTTASSFPSATVGFVPSATAVANGDPGVVYKPANAWTSSSSATPNCSFSNSIRTTSAVNSSVSFNYTGVLSLVHICDFISSTYVPRQARVFKFTS